MRRFNARFGLLFHVSQNIFTVQFLVLFSRCGSRWTVVFRENPRLPFWLLCLADRNPRQPAGHPTLCLLTSVLPCMSNKHGEVVMSP